MTRRRDQQPAPAGRGRPPAFLADQPWIPAYLAVIFAMLGVGQAAQAMAADGPASVFFHVGLAVAQLGGAVFYAIVWWRSRADRPARGSAAQHVEERFDQRR